MFEYTDGFDFINSFSHSGKPVKDLSRIRLLMKAVGDPQDRLKFIHIAGTNGKGSIAQMFSEVFTSAGYKTGLFTSPYIIEYSDRIRVNGENITSEALDRLAPIVQAAVEKLPQKEDLSQFEITQAIAFLYFEQCGCDIVVLETGLGGLLDCTNVVTTSVLTVIGSVDYDHTAILGDTLSEIAAQKAGIIKPCVPCVLSAGNSPEVLKAVNCTAAEKNAPLVIVEADRNGLESCGVFGNSFVYKGYRYRTSMGGAHQYINALSVIEGISLLKEKFPIPQEALSEGIERAKLAGRTEVICKAPLTILDGAHNPDGIKALAKVISQSGVKPVRAVIGMCRDKNMSEAVKKLIPTVGYFVTVDGFSERAAEKSELAEIICRSGGRAVPAQGDLTAEIRTMQQENPKGLNLICGSLFLVAQVKHLGIR